MRVKDPRHYKGEGVLILNLSDDARRIIVRIESTVPTFGKNCFDPREFYQRSALGSFPYKVRRTVRTNVPHPPRL